MYKELIAYTLLYYVPNVINYKRSLNRSNLQNKIIKNKKRVFNNRLIKQDITALNIICVKQMLNKSNQYTYNSQN